MIIYGEPGSGKTTWLGNSKNGILTVPNACPVLYLDFDDKIKPIRSTVNDIPISEIGSWESFQPDKINRLSFQVTDRTLDAVYKQLNRLCGEAGAITEDNFPAKTIVVDSSTHLSELLSRYTLKYHKVNRVSPEVLSQQDYGMVANLQSRILSNLISSGHNVILLCHVRQDHYKDGSLKSEEPLFIGKMTRQVIPGKVDYGGYLYINKSGNRQIDWTEKSNAVVQRWVNQSIEIGVDKDLPTDADFSKLAYLFDN